MRTVYLGTSAFAAAVLGELYESAHRPALVLTRPDRPRGRGRRVQPPPVAIAARDLELELYQPESVNSEAARELIAQAQPEVVVVCAFGALIKQPLLSEQLILNVHPSLLPRWRGAAPIERAMIAGDDRTGVSIIVLREGLDSGPVCGQAEEPIRGDDDYGSLSTRLQTLGGRLLLETLDEIAADGRPTCSEQDDAEATYADKITPADRRLDPGQPAAALARRVRALSPHIGAYVELPGGGGRLGVLAAEAIADRTAVVADPGSGGGAHSSDANGLRPGELSLDGRRPRLGCSPGVLELSVVQPPGRRPMVAEDYLRGLRR